MFWTDVPRTRFAVHATVANGHQAIVVSDMRYEYGNDTVTGVEHFVFGDRSIGLAALLPTKTSSFDGGAWDDVLLWNSSSGRLVYNDMVEGRATGLVEIVAGLPAGLYPVGHGDLDGDNRADILLRDGSTGDTYYMTTGPGAALRTITTSVTPSLHAIDVADFNGDGQNDVLFRDDGGFLFYARMQSGGFAGWANVGNLGTTWRTLGAGDFNGDGVADVAFQEIATGFTVYRDLANQAWGYVAGGLGTTWLGGGIGDVNGDGFDDVIFRNLQDGTILWHDMAGGNGYATGWGIVATGFGAWEVRGTADPDNDGYADIIVQHAGNGTAVWLDMNAGVASGQSGLIAFSVGTNWIVGL